MEPSEKSLLFKGNNAHQLNSSIAAETNTMNPRQLGDPEVPRRQPPLRVRIQWAVEDWIDDNIMRLTWQHVLYKTLAFAWLSANLYLFYLTARNLLPFANPYNWDRNVHPHLWGKAPRVDKEFLKPQEFNNYFSTYDGFSQCDIKARDLYSPPVFGNNGKTGSGGFCATRRELLESMSGGGRHGFDAPYTPYDCHYRWFTAQEICMIIDRFDGIVFVGDNSLQSIYNGFNILLRQDLVSGALKSWEMERGLLDTCRCDSQFSTPACSQYFVTSSDEVKTKAYSCARFPHGILRIDGSPAQAATHTQFNKLVPMADRSNYHPIPIVHALSPSTASASSASQSLSEFLQLADASKRITPMLWIGPTAAGHIDTKNRKGNQEIWDFDSEVASVAIQNDIEVLKMWNMTAQASSHDGVGFGEKVAITQAMMVVNWLSRLESR